MPAFTITYDIVTPDSAEHGDVAEMGFVDARDNLCELQPHMCGPDAAAFKAQFGLRLRDAVELIGCVETDAAMESYYETDGRSDYRTGAETRYALHLPDNATTASRKRVARLLRSRKLL